MDEPSAFLCACTAFALAGLAVRWRTPARSRWAAVGLASFWVGLGGIAGEGAAAWRDQGIRRELLQRCRMVAAALDRRDLAEHRNLVADIGQPWFMRVKERLADARSADPDLVYVYLMEQVGPRILFPNGDDPMSRADYDPPGSEYADATPEMRRAVASGSSFSLGPYRDHWGEFITVGAPISVAPGRGMHLALDLDASRWRHEMWLWRLWPTLLGAALAGIAVLMWSRGNALERARDAAKAEEEANRAKDAYLATVTHDLRTPLSGIIGMTGLLADTELSPSQREYLQLAHESGQQLLTLVNELLDYARIEAGELEFDHVRTPLRELVEDAVALISPLASSKGIELNAVVDRGVPASLLGDPDRLRQLLHNLVGNAVKFTDEGEVAVLVSAAPADGGRVRITMAVRDTGTGIDAGTMDRLFKPFSQGSEARRRRGGTGLGLCIAQRIARGLGGDITVASAPRAGSTFTATAVLDPDPHPPEIDLVKPAHRGARIVVGVEQPTLRGGLCELLASLGLEPVVAADPADAARQASTTPTPAAAIVEAGWARHAGAGLVAAGVPVATIASRGAGGTQVLASRRTPILLRPVRRDGLLRLLSGLWSDRVATGRIVRPETAALRRAGAPPAPGDRQASAQTVELFASGLRASLDAVREAVGKGELHAVRRIAQGLRTAAEPLQLGELAGACRSLEDAAMAGDREAVRAAAASLDGIRRATQERLDRMRRDAAH